MFCVRGIAVRQKATVNPICKFHSENCYFPICFLMWCSEMVELLVETKNYRSEYKKDRQEPKIEIVFFYSDAQKYSRLRCLLHVKGLMIRFYLG